MLHNRIPIALASLAALIFATSFERFPTLFSNVQRWWAAAALAMAAYLVWAFKLPSKSKRKRIALTAGLGVVFLTVAFIALIFVAALYGSFG